MNPLDLAWNVVKSDFKDIAPMPSKYIFHPDSRTDDGKKIMSRRHEKVYNEPHFSGMTGPQYHQGSMEESYMPDLMRVLELMDLREATKSERKEGQEPTLDMVSPLEYESEEYPVEYYNLPPQFRSGQYTGGQ